MTKWRYHDFRCECCGAELVDVLFDMDTELAESFCTACDKPMVIQLGAPNLMVAAYPDGTNRGVEFDKLKMKCDLQVEQAEAATPSEKKVLQKEIDKL